MVLIMRFLVLWASLQAAPAWAVLEQQVCAVGQASGLKGHAGWKFCAYRYTNSSRNVLYYFHGIGGNERDWKNHELEKSIVRRWESLGLRPPIVVSVSLGPIWLLTEKGQSTNSGNYEFFRDQIIPEISRRVFAFKPKENWLLGVSMGGFNAAQFYFKNPEFFTRAALICGAMTQVSPFSSPYTVNAYILRTKAWPVLIWGALAIMKSYLPDSAAWLRHSPIELARQKFSRKSLPLFVSNSTADEFGFHEGNIDLARWARERGVDVKSEFYPGGGHCQVDPRPIADFF